MATSRLPRQLTSKYNELLRERAEGVARLKELDQELASLEYSLRLLAPEWRPPARPAKKLKPSRLPYGVLARDCLNFLKCDGELWTPELVARLAQRHRLAFPGRKEEQDFASAVAMALRRYERQGVLEVVEKDSKTQALRWRLCMDDRPTIQ